MTGTKVKINKEENKRNYFNSISSNNNSAFNISRNKHKHVNSAEWNTK